MLKKLFRYLFSFILIVAVAAGTTYYFVRGSQNFGASIPTVVANFSTSLQSRLTSSDTSMTLVRGTDAAGNALSGYMCFTLDEGSSSQEHVCGTATGTSVTGLLRGIDPRDGNLEVTALKKAHAKGGSVKVTDFPIIGILARQLNGQESIPTIIYYPGSQNFSLASASAIVDKNYVDGVAIAGCANATLLLQGCAELASVAEIEAGTGLGGTGARLFINPSYFASSSYTTLRPTAGEKAGLAGNLASPSATNKFITLSNIWGKDLTTSQKILTFSLTASAQGDILFRNSSGDYVNLAPGASGSYLKSNGAGANPTWSTSAPTSKVGTIQRVANAGNGTVSTAHGLGRVPRVVRMYASFTASNDEHSVSTGIWTPSGVASQFSCNDPSGVASGVSTTNILEIHVGNDCGSESHATITVDATNINLTWTESGTSALTIQIVYEVQ